MHKLIAGVAFCTAAFAMSAAAQTNTFPASGNVGIGTTNPAVQLHVSASAASTNSFIGTTATGTGSIAGLVIGGADGYFTGGDYWEAYQQISNLKTLYIDGPNPYVTGTPQLVILQGGGNVGIGTTSPATPLDVVANPTGTIPQVRISPVGLTGSSTSLPSYLDFYSTFDAYPADQGPRRTATIKARYSGGVWGNEALAFEVGTGGVNDAANEPTERMRIAGNGNVGIGTTSPGAKLEVSGNLKLTANSGASITFQDGTVQSTAYTGVVCGGDYAELVDVTGSRTNYEPGDLLVIDPSAPGKFLKANQAYTTLVAGIYSTKPGTLGRRQTTAKSPDEVPMAMVGIVPTKVSAENGPIKTGDLLVASSTLGRAMKGTDRSLLTGAVIGKALGNLDSGTGIIEVVVTLQ